MKKTDGPYMVIPIKRSRDVYIRRGEGKSIRLSGLAVSWSNGICELMNFAYSAGAASRKTGKKGKVSK